MPPPQHVRSALAVVLALVVTVGATTFLLTGVAATERSLQLFLSPHPDDEMQAWAALEADPAAYTVFVTLTQGEDTEYCEPAALAGNLQERWGERPPVPTPAGRHSPECAQARINAWVEFLDRAAEVTPEAATGTTTEAVVSLPDPVGVAHNPHATLGANRARAWIGPEGARLALDLGDGNLTAAEVTWAVRAVLDLRGRSLPDLPVSSIIAAAYTSDLPVLGVGAAGCTGPCAGAHRAFEYERPDHRAVNQALPALAPLSRGGAWRVTHPFDPAATHRYALRVPDYHALMGLGAPVDDEPGSQRREGAHQVVFGWLAFGAEYWHPGELAEDGVLFPRRQAFIHVPGVP